MTTQSLFPNLARITVLGLSSAFLINCSNGGGSSDTPTTPVFASTDVDNALFVGAAYEKFDADGKIQITQSTSNYYQCTEVLIDPQDKAEFSKVRNMVKKRTQIKRCPKSKTVGSCTRVTNLGDVKKVYIRLYVSTKKYSLDVIQSECSKAGGVFVAR